jgi:hypothetical protein
MQNKDELKGIILAVACLQMSSNLSYLRIDIF